MLKEHIAHALIMGSLLILLSACGKKTVVDHKALEEAISKSDDFEKHKYIFLHHSSMLVKNNWCTIEELKENGGWIQSTEKSDNYFTYCGGMHMNNKHYINVRLNVHTVREPI